MTRLRRLAPWLATLLALVFYAAFGALNLRFADPLPYSDESAHLNKVLNLGGVLSLTEDALQRAHVALFSSDPYPQGVHLWTLLVPEGTRSVDAVRLSMHAFALLHVLVALTVGPRVLGRAGAWTYALLVGLSPLPLAYQRIYLIDVPLVAMVGMATLLARASEGFSRPLPSLALAVVASLGMQTKWVFAGFVALPVALAAGEAVWRSSARWSVRLAVALGVTALSAGVGLAIPALGRSAMAQAWQLRGEHPEAPVALAGAGWLLAAGWLVVGLRSAWQLRAGRMGTDKVTDEAVSADSPPATRGLGPVANLLAALVVVSLTAGTWYVLVYTQLLGRLELEQGQYALRGGRASWVESREIVELLVPGWPLWLALGGVGVLRARRGAAWMVAGLAGAGLAFYGVVSTLPFDPRYLLPLLPLLASAVVAGWEELGRGRWFATGALGGVMVIVGVAPLWDTSALGRHPSLGVAVNVKEVAGVPVARLARSHRRQGRKDAVDALVAQMAAACPVGPCEVPYLKHPDMNLQGRGLEALLGFAGTPIRVVERAEFRGTMPTFIASCVQPAAPLPEARCVAGPLMTEACVVYACTRD